MPKQIPIKGFVYMVKWFADDTPEFVVMSCDSLADKHYTLVGPAHFDYTMPAEFDVTKAQLARIDREEQDLRAKFAAAVVELQRQKNELLCIENTATVEA